MVAAFRQTEVPGLTANEPSFHYPDPMFVDNGGKKCRVDFYVTLSALDYWANATGRAKKSGRDVLILDFYKENLTKFQDLLKIALSRIIKHYRGFPSPIHLTERIAFCFSLSSQYAAATQKMTEEFELIIVWFNVANIWSTDSERLSMIEHELLHIISQSHENEKGMRILIRGCQDKLKGKIYKNKETVDKGVKELENYCKKIMFGGNEAILKRVESSIEYFYLYSTEQFWNLIADSALCVIAMELEDHDYVWPCIQRDERRVYDCENKFLDIESIMKYAIKNEIGLQKRNFLLAALRLIQFINCFEAMPIESVAYAVLGEKWHENARTKFFSIFGKQWHRNAASAVIHNFKKLVISHCDHAVAEGFLRFYESYVHIIRAQSIHNNPLNPNISQQIHNTEALSRGEEAYNILNREFHKLFQELKNTSK